MTVRLGSIDKIDACALPALLNAHVSVLAFNSDQRDIHAALNVELAGFGLPAVPAAAVDAWADQVRAGRMERPELGMHTRQDIRGEGHSFGSVQFPELFAPDYPHGLEALQLRIVRYGESPGDNVATVIAWKGTWRSVIRDGILRLERDVTFDHGANFSIFMSASAFAKSCLAEIRSAGLN